MTIAFAATALQVPAYAQMPMLPTLPAPGTMVHLSGNFTPAHLLGMIVHPDNPLQFDFLINRGDVEMDPAQKREEYKKLVKYFLASLTIPDGHQWVNLSPYERDRIIQNDFGKTEMGRDLLAQDYILKQITSTLLYPESNLGKKFWDKVYQRAWDEYHTTDVPVNTFNKVWIVPDQAVVYESGNSAYIVQSHLKVMLEEDYLSLQKHTAISNPDAARAVNDTHAIGSQVLREIVLPQLEKEVNEGKNFANLRQMYSGMVLATWYKAEMKKSLLGMIYANKDKVKGVDQNPAANEVIYRQYLRAFKKGVFNYIKEDTDRYTNEQVPRKYFSGGFDPGAGTAVRVSSEGEAKKMAEHPDDGRVAVVNGDGNQAASRELKILIPQWENVSFSVSIQRSNIADKVTVDLTGANGASAATQSIESQPAVAPKESAMTAEAKRVALKFVDYMKNKSFPAFNIPADQLARAKQEGEKNWAISSALLEKLRNQLANWGVASDLSSPVFEHLDYEYAKATDSFRVVYVNPAMLSDDQIDQLDAPTPEDIKANHGFEVLVVDDDDIIRNMWAQMLMGRGFNVQVAPDGLEALKMIKENPPDYVLTDYTMPGMDGLELARAIEQLPNKKPKVVMHTGGDARSLLLKAPAVVVKVFQKPMLGLDRFFNYLRQQDQLNASPAMMAEKFDAFVPAYEKSADLRTLIPAIKNNFGSVEKFMRAALSAGYEFVKAPEYPKGGAIDTVNGEVVIGFNEVQLVNLLVLRYKGRPVNDRIIFFQPPAEKSNAAMASNKLINALAVAGGLLAAMLMLWNPAKQHWELSRAEETPPGIIARISPNSPSKKLVINKGGVGIIVTTPGQNQITAVNVRPGDLNKIFNELRKNTPSNAVIHVFYDGTGEGIAGTFMHSSLANIVDLHKVYLDNAWPLYLVFSTVHGTLYIHYFNRDGVDHAYVVLDKDGKGKGILRQLPNANNPNPAMIAASMKKRGGIDLNAANLNLFIKRDGNGVPLPWIQQDLTPFKKIQGFVPQIVEIRPAINVPIISELQAKLQTR